MERRRRVQSTWNEAHGITPQTVVRAVRDTVGAVYADRDYLDLTGLDREREGAGGGDRAALERRRLEAERAMRDAAKAMRFEEAAKQRDEMRRIEALLLRVGEERGL